MDLPNLVEFLSTLGSHGILIVIVIVLYNQNRELNAKIDALHEKLEDCLKNRESAD